MIVRRVLTEATVRINERIHLREKRLEPLVAPARGAF